MKEFWTGSAFLNFVNFIDPKLLYPGLHAALFGRSIPATLTFFLLSFLTFLFLLLCLSPLASLSHTFLLLPLLVQHSQQINKIRGEKGKEEKEKSASSWKLWRNTESRGKPFYSCVFTCKCSLQGVIVLV